jgi:hypothetical protein
MISFRKFWKLFFCIICTALQLSAQNVQEPPDNIYLMELLPRRSYYLDGGISSILGGASREAISITVPPKTVEWGYIISTYRNQADVESAKSTQSFYNFILDSYDKTKLISTALNVALPISSVGYCDVW